VTRTVLGVGSSHTPQLSSGAEHWRAHGERDQRNGALIGPDGQAASFDRLVAVAPAWLAAELTDEAIIRQAPPRPGRGDAGGAGRTLYFFALGRQGEDYAPPGRSGRSGSNTS
jgi:hypothetical protein